MSVGLMFDQARVTADLKRKKKEKKRKTEGPDTDHVTVVTATRCTSIRPACLVFIGCQQPCPGLLGNSSQLTTGLKGASERKKPNSV